MAMQAIRTRRMAWIALVAVVLVLAFNGPSEARGGGGGGHAGGGAHVGGGHPSGGHFNAHHFEGGRFHHGWRGGYTYPYYGIYPYYGYDSGSDYAPDYPYQPPTAWWYCPSYGAYYPSVTSCPEAWTPVPAS